jgi:hypothetical protein
MYSNDELLLAVAKKKPRIQALIDQLDQTTQEQIDALSEPLWMRQALSRLKLSGGVGQKQRLQNIIDAADAQELKARLAPKPTFEVRLFSGMETYIGTNTGDRDWKILVEPQDSFLFVDDEKVRFGDSILSVDDLDRKSLEQSSKLVGFMTMDQYRGFHRALLNQRHKF